MHGLLRQKAFFHFFSEEALQDLVDRYAYTTTVSSFFASGEVVFLTSFVEASFLTSHADVSTTQKVIGWCISCSFQEVCALAFNNSQSYYTTTTAEQNQP